MKIYDRFMYTWSFKIVYRSVYVFFLFIYKNVQRKKYGKICCDNITRNINESHDTYMYLYI